MPEPEPEVTPSPTLPLPSPVPSPSPSPAPNPTLVPSIAYTNPATVITSFPIPSPFPTASPAPAIPIESMTLQLGRLIKIDNDVLHCHGSQIQGVARASKPSDATNLIQLQEVRDGIVAQLTNVANTSRDTDNNLIAMIQSANDRAAAAEAQLALTLAGVNNTVRALVEHFMPDIDTEGPLPFSFPVIDPNADIAVL